MYIYIYIVYSSHAEQTCPGADFGFSTRIELPLKAPPSLEVYRVTTKWKMENGVQRVRTSEYG